MFLHIKTKDMKIVTKQRWKQVFVWSESQVTLRSQIKTGSPKQVKDTWVHRVTSILNVFT